LRARRANVLCGVLCTTIAVVAIASPASGHSGTSATLHVGLVPERLGRGTTLEFGFDLVGPAGGVPQPITTVSLFYPHDFGILTSGLGQASCTTATLEAHGPPGCPSRSLMGYGTATGAIQVEGRRVDEEALTAIYLAPFHNGEIALLFFLDAYTPLFAERVFDGVLQSAPPPFGGALVINVPAIESFPEGPNVALVKLRSTIGPLGITYYERTHGHFVPYRPSGIVLPLHCPKGGFPFAARFTFANGHRLTAKRNVRCPHTGG
jgi:hypothetical protein